MNARARVLVTAAALAAAAAPAQAQLGALRRLHPTAGGVVYLARQGSDVEEESRTGTWAGVDVAATTGRFVVRLRGMAGPLGGPAGGLDQDVRETVLSVSMPVRPWLEVGIEGVALRLESELATTVWRLYGARVGLVREIGVEGLRARAELAVYPLTSVKNARALNRPMRAEVGVAWASPRWPVEAHFGYRVESIDFEDTNDLRIAGLVAGLAVRPWR